MTSFMSCSMRRMPTPKRSRMKRMRAISSTFSCGFMPAAGSSSRRIEGRGGRGEGEGGLGGGGEGEAGDEVEGGRLPGAVRADQADQLGRADADAEVREGRQPAESAGGFARLEGHPRGRRPVRRRSAG